MNAAALHAGMESMQDQIRIGHGSSFTYTSEHGVCHVCPHNNKTGE